MLVKIRTHGCIYYKTSMNVSLKFSYAHISHVILRLIMLGSLFRLCVTFSNFLEILMDVERWKSIGELERQKFEIGQRN